MLEKRQIERFKMKVLTRLIVLTAGKKKEMIELYTSDISARGAFLVTDHEIPEGTSIKLDFVLSVNKLIELIGTNSFIKIAGKVVRTGPEGIAISFDKGYEIMPYRHQ